MTERYHNPFAGTDLIAPVSQHHYYEKYTQTGGNAQINRQPFQRMVDFWFVALLVAVRNRWKGLDLDGKKTTKMTDGSILDRDPWRVQCIMLIMVGEFDRVDVLLEPRKMIQTANSLAAAGAEQVVAMLENGDDEPIWNLSDELDKLLR